MEASPSTLNKVRIVTATSLFDGHDASINVMRRIIQSVGVEVIHLGHNRSVAEIVECAIQEDAQAVAITSYQGGHLEFFKYMYDLFQSRSANIKIFGGGGGVILPSEMEELHAYGITRIYSPDDGREMGLVGMINDLVQASDFASHTPPAAPLINKLDKTDPGSVAALITLVENHPEESEIIRTAMKKRIGSKTVPVLGVTGTGGAGKSSLVDELVRRFLLDFADKSLAIISVDPSKRKTGGALLGDRIRMNAIHDPRVYMRSLATRQSNLSISTSVQDSIDICKAAGFDFVIVETSGIGQSDTQIVEHSDVALYVMTADYGAATQLEKIDMLDFADVIALNKFDHRGALDALRDVKKQYRRNNLLWDAPEEELPIYGTIASQFNDPGMNELYQCIITTLAQKTGVALAPSDALEIKRSDGKTIIPPARVRYLSEIAENSARQDAFMDEQATIASTLYQLKGTIELLLQDEGQECVELVDNNCQEVVHAVASTKKAPGYVADLKDRYAALDARLDPACRDLVHNWPQVQQRYKALKYKFQVRERVIEQDLYNESLAHTKIPKVSLPDHKDWGDILRWQLSENAPGLYPYTAGVFPLKRAGEDPARQFAGEGGPERTNKRFHYLSLENPAKRLSTAFDSVTLYGQDPENRPDIYGKIGNSGVSICTLDDAKKLYSGYNLADPKTSVSMTINGPAPMMLGFFMNAAIDQQCELFIKNQNIEAEVEKRIDSLYRSKNLPRPRYNESLPSGNDGLGLSLLGVTGDQVLDPAHYQRIKTETLRQVRGTVQADILKEDQAQNTCIFSTEFALKMMGDIQQYFIDQQVKNFYSVSISGYHIAEAGANPITQLALTLANGFTYVEYYLSRGMHIDAFAPNLSFFFSNGMDPEYSVMGRVARRLWAKAIRHKYGGNARSQKLKYHIQTSGRSLHAQEIGFNDIRTTLQAVYAIFDNCNSLHTNAYDEAITTPTEESVRRAMAIQLIINKELGLAKSENALQGSFIINELTDIVEQAVLEEFRAISRRGGVLGAMERMYQRSKIQEESMHYEQLKHNGELPIMGVNTFLNPSGSPTIVPKEVIRSTEEERDFAISSREAFQHRNLGAADEALTRLQKTAIANENIFEVMMDASKVCSLGQMSKALYEVGGQYRRNM